MSQSLAEQLRLNAALIARRLDHGDQADVPRQVDHVLKVPKKALAALARDLQESGFAVLGGTKGLRRVWLEFSREDRVTEAAAAAFTSDILIIAARHGAQYDGWGAEVIQDPDRR